LLIVIGFSCNNNCILCSLRPQADVFEDKSTEEIEEEISRGFSDGYRRIEFTGGEPTIRPDIAELVDHAKKMGFQEIILSTNGRMFAYEQFLSGLVSNGLDQITLTLYGSHPEIHDAIARAPGSFDQTLRAIENIVNQPNVDLSVNTVICRLNLNDLINIGKLLLKLKVEIWGILDLIPFGNAEENYSELTVDFANLVKAVSKLSYFAKKNIEIHFFDFPLCFLGFKIKALPRARIFNAKEKTDEFEQTGYGANRFKYKAGHYDDFHKRRINCCRGCLAEKDCAGIWKKYLDIYGKEATEKVVSKIKSRNLSS
jgi:MoaA/NifB/PqqE/SkfB family radical SAM enzyme